MKCEVNPTVNKQSRGVRCNRSQWPLWKNLSSRSVFLNRWSLKVGQGIMPVLWTYVCLWKCVFIFVLLPGKKNHLVTAPVYMLLSTLYNCYLLHETKKKPSRSWILKPWCYSKLSPSITKLTFLRERPVFPGQTVVAVQSQAYEWTVSGLDPLIASWRSLGWESKWPTLSSPSATTTELPWSKALNPLLMLLHSKD